MRLINFDTEEVPEVWDMGSDDFGRTRGAAAEGSHIDFPADIAYTNSYHGRLSLMPNRRLGMSEVNQPSPEECWSHATSRSIDISDSEFTDDDLSTNRIQVGDGMCLITDQENLVWWQVTETIDNDPHPFNTMGGHTIEGVATLWERS
ncbi:hypothetical protein CLV72_104577 [Allonocardiopsis opalescens]|uniref:Uncharacterized protein n=1 Tax=Allonocardiopsis opalescens TaxID=1144618 RepID=A0A2T0Q5A0_9ACTN|nr:hypothetical protein CLV72_104577 [Allonocardiopsis opalescens]